MFCPQCGAEYRPGFTVCADCEVPLVWGLSARSTDGGGADNRDAPESVPGSEEDPFCAFWKGDDPRVHAELCELLEEKGIPHKTVRRADHLFNLNTKSSFQLGVPFSYFEKAEAAVKEVYGNDDDAGVPPNPLPSGEARGAEASIFAGLVEMAKDLGRNVRGMSAIYEEQREPESAAEDVVEGESQNQRSSWDPDHWFPEDATAEVWSGDQPELGEMIAASLQENQIHSRFDQADGKWTLLVLHEDETRARKIVHEVVEGVSPE